MRTTKRVFNPAKNLFLILRMNARSIRYKKYGIELHLHKLANRVDVLGFTESRLRDSRGLPTLFQDLPSSRLVGYTVVRTNVT